MKALISTLFCLLITSCIHLPYAADTLAMTPAEGNVAEYPAFVNGKPCKPDLGSVGVCTVVLPRTSKVTLYVPPMDDSFTINIECGFAEGKYLRIKEDVTEKKGRSYEIPLEYYDYVKSRFLCTGRIYPIGNEEIVRNSFEVLIRLISDKYEPREAPYVVDSYLVMGKSAYKTTCRKNGKWYFDTKKTIIKAKGLEYCFSISEKGRINTWSI